MPRLPTIGFDTRGINQLEDGGEHAEQLMKALRGGFEVLLPAMTVDELLSTPETKNPRREKLLARCERLLASGQCLWPRQRLHLPGMLRIQCIFDVVCPQKQRASNHTDNDF